MPLTESSSLPVASILALLTFSGMQWAKPLLASSQPMTILGGFLGSILFVFILTAIGNLEQVLFGKGKKDYSIRWTLELCTYTKAHFGWFY